MTGSARLAPFRECSSACGRRFLAGISGLLRGMQHTGPIKLACASSRAPTRWRDLRKPTQSDRAPTCTPVRASQHGFGLSKGFDQQKRDSMNLQHKRHCPIAPLGCLRCSSALPASEHADVTITSRAQPSLFAFSRTCGIETIRNSEGRA
jgi:hypothetical protein